VCGGLLRFLFLEPFFGGSHKEFSEGLVSNSRYQIDLLTMTERNWRWRMRGASLHFANKISSIESYDGIIVSDMMNLADFKALVGAKCPPVLAYFHENQITYPPVPGEKNEFYFGIINLTTALVADRILFNSKMHLEAFSKGILSFINKVPDYNPKWVKEKIHSKSNCLYPGCRFSSEQETFHQKENKIPLIIWNHRWGFDKNAKVFFEAIDKVFENNLDVNLALMGDNFTMIPDEFSEAKKKYGDRIVQFGFVEKREDYINWLKKGSIVISTANHENFGIAMVEAMRFGCIPLLPKRLSYPEILPEKFHKSFLYKNKYELVEKLSFIIKNISKFDDMRKKISASMARFSWENLIEKYDIELEKLANTTIAIKK